MNHQHENKILTLITSKKNIHFYFLFYINFINFKISVFAYLPHNETLSNKFKIINGNKDKSSVQIPESRHDSNLAVDNSIIHQVLFNKKTNSTNQKPVTFTVKL